MKRILIIFLCMCLWETSAVAQHVLLLESNSMRPGDSFALINIEKLRPGNEGVEQVWDFSDTGTTGDIQSVQVLSDSCGSLIRIGIGQKNVFCWQGDALWKTYYEDDLKNIRFDEPILEMLFPLQYGDSLTASFAGTGKYCGDHNMKITGKRFIEADAEGIILSEEMDTLTNVLRVHTQTVMSYTLDIDSLALDTAMTGMEFEEKYDWYIRGMRYPVYTSQRVTCYTGNTQVFSYCENYKLMSDYLSFEDEANDSIQAVDSLFATPKIQAEKEVIHYQVSVENGVVHVDYTLDEDANVTGVVANVMGVRYFTQRQRGASGKQMTMDFNCNSLPHGTYTLYLNVNGMVNSSTITI